MNMGQLEYDLLMELAAAVHELAPPDHQKRIAEKVRALKYVAQLRDLNHETLPPSTDE